MSAVSAQLKAAAPPVFGQPFTNQFSDASASGPHLFFFHYQTSGGDYGKSWNPAPFADGSTSPSVAQSTQDIDEAASCGADGFSMDLQGNTNAYASATENMLTAGDQWKPTPAAAGVGVTGFHSFLTFDFATFPEDPALITAWIVRAVKHPSYYKYKGAYFVSTYAGEGGGYAVVKSVWQPVLAALKAQGISIYFVPGFNPTDAAGTYLAGNTAGYTAQAQGLLAPLPAQGCWQYGLGLGLPLLVGNSTVPAAQDLAQVTAASGLTFMATVSFNYQGLDKPGRWYNEYNGGEVQDEEWRSILLAQKPLWVQGVTWNDFGEYSRWSSADEGPASPWPYLAHSSQAGYYLQTLGQQALLRYYIQWYKTGQQPGFASDHLFAFYRTQPALLDVPGDEANKPGYVTTDSGAGAGPSLAPDTFFLTTGLPAQRTLTVVNGGQTITRLVPAGLSFLRVGPFLPGSVKITLTKEDGTVTATLTGHDIASTAAFYDWSQWSGYAHN